MENVPIVLAHDIWVSSIFPFRQTNKHKKRPSLGEEEKKWKTLLESIASHAIDGERIDLGYWDSQIE
jgi:hypothetical protein